MKTLRKQVAVTLFLAMLATWVAVFTLIYLEQTRAETGMSDQNLRDGAQKALLSVPTSLLQASSTGEDRFELPGAARFALRSVHLQVWSLADKRLLVQSPWAPDEPMVPDFSNGFHDITLDGKPWRAYAVSDTDGRVQVQFAKSAAQLRDETTRRMWSGLVFLSVLFLILTGLTWLVMRRAFRPVDRARDTILGRSGMDLTPLPTAGMPGELQPFIRSINDLLERLSASLDRERRFLADAAHELRTPLAALSAYAELAARSDTPQARDQAVDKLRDVATRTTRLAEQLLDQARTEALNEGPADPVALNRLAEMIVRDSEALANRKNQRISLEADAVEVHGGVDALGVLLRNLLDNALRYTPEGGRVAVSCGPLPDGGARLSVADNGPGIAPAERERVFDRFYRKPGTVERGSGIGLSLVAQVAAKHNARIEWGPGLDGRGVGITVTFPASGA
ncbi:ATP-binding protein [Achromobacter sp. UMC46]|uniref:ATP-binding protein n=1 Tax=Achromobacter sp. UMC46 TaxID=1862319 RepID=UPI001602A35C|nr:ATP-binding protein [Achromobacter sp. UMC46]MBB1594593.1 two-component sensor histidine kinase [Achromobacter sp. UMC46]